MDYIHINISKRENDDKKELFKTACSVLNKCGGHERDQILLYNDLHPTSSIPNHYVWNFTFFTKNILEKHEKILREFQLRFPDREVLCPDQKDEKSVFIEKLTNSVFSVTEFIGSINIQRLNEREKKSLQEIQKKYYFAIKSGDIRRSVQNLIKKNNISVLIELFDITIFLKKLENNQEINTSEPQKAVNNLLEDLNDYFFILPFKRMYKQVNDLWRQEFEWYLFKELSPDDNYVFNFLKVPKNEIQDFKSQIQNLHKLLVECINAVDLRKALQQLNTPDEELKNEKGEWKKPLLLLKIWYAKKLNISNSELIGFLELLHYVRGEVSHILGSDGLSNKRGFKSMQEFIIEKNCFSLSDSLSDFFKAILKACENLFEIEFFDQIH